MNIIKFRNGKKEDNLYFNEHLNNKYAFFINWKYIIALDEITIDEYTALERGEHEISSLDPERVFDIDKLDWIFNHIDFNETKNINSIDKFIKYNDYIPSGDLTIEQIKNFRTWLAKSLLNLDTYNDDIFHMLNFYAKNMYDDTLKYLDIFGKQINMTNIAHTGCSCCGGSSDLSSLYNTNLGVCDCASVYKTGIHNLMVKTFSEIEFWSTKMDKFLIEFKLYIDNIIKLNLPIKPTYISDFVDCGCQQGANDNIYNIILKNLSTSLEYIITNNISGHKLFITDSLNKWADILYDSMQWD